MEFSCFYPTELSPKEIFNSMQKNIFDFSQNINQKNTKYLYLRSKLLNLVRQISAKMFFKSQTYFLSIYYLDIIFSNNNKEIDLNYYKIALACLLLSAKYCENDPMVPALKYFIKIYNKIIGNKSAISVSDLFYSEVMAIKLLNHKLNYYTIYDFNSFFFNHNILTEEQLKSIDINFDIKNNKNIFSKNNNNNSSKVKKIYEKIYRLSRYYLDILLGKKVCVKYSSLLLSIYILKKSVESILLQEIYYNNNNTKISTEKFLIIINNDFDTIIKGYYGFDYENIPEYQQLINEFDIKQIIKQNSFNGLHPREYNIRQNKTLSSFNKKENDKIISKEKDRDKSNNKNIEKIEDNNNNLTSKKLNFQKLNSTNNLKERLKTFQTLTDFSRQNLPFENNKIIKINENKQKHLNRNLLINNGTNEQYSLKSKKSINIDIKNYFSEKLNNTKNPEINFLSPNNISINKNISNMIKRSKDKTNKKEIYNNLNINDFDNYDEINEINYFGRYTFNANNLTAKNTNKKLQMTRPYYKKVIQNYNSKLKNKNINNNNKISNKYYFDNIKINQYLKKKNTNQKINNEFISKYEFNTETKTKHDINKKLNYKDFNTINLSKEFNKKASFSNNKEKKICNLLHINLNPKFSEVSSPLNNLYVNKKIDDEVLSSASYVNKMNSIMKKIERKSSNSINKIENLMNKRKNNRYNDVQLNSNFIEEQNYNKIKNLRLESDDIDNNFSSNKLSNSLKILGFKLMMKSKKEKTKKNISKNKNKIYFTDNNILSGDENPNKINLDQNLNGYLMAKKIEVKKNKFDNEIKHRVNKNKNNNLLNFNRYNNQNLEENINKKNTSTIVINNNININFGNKSINGYKETKKYGQNSISSLLHKIPISYKTSENY